ncbi:hypothetical protein [Paeniglutamicibacter sp. NPDC091659]|uniref:hypothetical protein n=1 Tax=Paeniglutamicibacter sp. NPDC091659 TaxID=3364389 RepID=UPI0038302C79
MAETVWILRHRRVSKLPNVRRDRESIIMIGFFASEQAARDAIARHRDGEGFIDYPDGWDIRELPMDVLLDEPVAY